MGTGAVESTGELELSNVSRPTIRKYVILILRCISTNKHVAQMHGHVNNRTNI